MVRYLEDLEPGQRFASGSLLVEAANIKSFATEFDPQPFHLDEDSARDSFRFDGERLAYRSDHDATARG